LSEQRASRFLSSFDSVGKIIAGLSGFVVLISAIVSLVYLVWPDPGPPPPPRKATLTITDDLGEQSFEFFLRSTNRSVEGYSRTQLDQLGRYYLVDVTFEGLRNSSPEIVWSLRSVDPTIQIQDPERWIHQFLARFKPPVNTYTRKAKVWIQRPAMRGTFYALIEIAYPRNETLDEIRTPTFQGRTGAEVQRTTTVSKTITIVATVPAKTSTTTTTVEGTISTSTTTTPAMTSTSVVTTPKTVLKPAPIVRPRAVIVPPRP
jgi:hypothetical protein